MVATAYAADSDSSRTWELNEPILTPTARGRTDRGKVRDENEDHFVIAELAKTLRVSETSLPGPAVLRSDVRGHLYIVADGMGGHAGGAEAARIAARTVESCVLNSLKWFLKMRGSEGSELTEKLREAVEEADARVIDAGNENPRLYGMGTTLTLAFVVNRELYVAHAGDTRCYLLRDGRLHRLTKDHTLAAELKRQGVLPEGGERKLRNVVYNAVGGTTPGVRPEVTRSHLESADQLLLCSDGLTDMLDDDAITGLLNEAASPEEACAALVAAANERGGRDNITAVVVAFNE